MENLTFAEWLATLPGAPSPSQVAKLAKLPHATTLRHAEKGQTTAENVVAIARAYKVSPLESLVKLGFLRPDEATSTEAMAIREALTRAEWEDLFNEISRRVNASGMFDGKFEMSIDSPINVLPPSE